MKGAPHLQLRLSRALWRELLRAALPVQLTEGEVDLLRDARRAVRQLGVRRQIRGLLEDRAPAPVRAARDRARAAWTRARPSVVQRVDDAVRVQGSWRVELDGLGTDLRYGAQRVGADAYLKATASGTIWLLAKNVEIPFLIEKRIGASVDLAEIRYDPGQQAVIGELRDLVVFLGEGPFLQLLARLAELALQGQLPKANPVPILRRDQVSELVGPMGGALKLAMGVDDLALEVTEQDLTLKVRFGFTQRQLSDQNEGGDDGW